MSGTDINEYTHWSDLMNENETFVPFDTNDKMYIFYKINLRLGYETRNDAHSSIQTPNTDIIFSDLKNEQLSHTTFVLGWTLDTLVDANFELTFEVGEDTLTDETKEVLLNAFQESLIKNLHVTKDDIELSLEYST